MCVNQYYIIIIIIRTKPEIKSKYKVYKLKSENKIHDKKQRIYRSLIFNPMLNLCHEIKQKEIF